MTIVTLEEDKDGNLVLPISDEMMAELGWKIGDNINWNDNKDGTWTMTKKQETELVLVECVSTFRMRYMVEVPKGKADWALDTVTMNEAKEFSQKHLGETIVSHRVISEEDALTLCDNENDYAKPWDNEHKMKAFFTKEGETKDW